MALEQKRYRPQNGNIRQINDNNPGTHHDALEFPDGQIWLLTGVCRDSGRVSVRISAVAIGRAALSVAFSSRVFDLVPAAGS